MTETRTNFFQVNQPELWSLQIRIPENGEAYLTLRAKDVGEFTAPVPADQIDVVRRIIVAAGEEPHTRAAPDDSRTVRPVTSRPIRSSASS